MNSLLQFPLFLNLNGCFLVQGAFWNDAGVRDFKLLYSSYESGPWTEENTNHFMIYIQFVTHVYQIVSGTMPDERGKAYPHPIEIFNFDIIVTRFVKFQMLSMVSHDKKVKSLFRYTRFCFVIYCQYGPYYGGLEYFKLSLSTDKITSELKKKIEVISSKDNTLSFYREIETSAFSEFEKTSARFYFKLKVLILGLDIIEPQYNKALRSLAPALVVPSTAVTQRLASHSDLRMENVVWEEQTGSRSHMLDHVKFFINIANIVYKICIGGLTKNK